MIVITGGGTGGHLAIARALAQELQSRKIPAIYIGSLYGQDQMWFAGESEEDWAFENRVGFWAKNGDCGGESAVTTAQGSSLASPCKAPFLAPKSCREQTAPESTKVDSSFQLQSPLFQQCYFLNTSGVVNKKGVKKLASIYAQLRAAWRVRKIFAKHRVQAVISVGGFSAGPASLAAILLRKPLFIHEQNAIQGKLNSLLAPFAKAVFNSFLPPFPPYPIKQEALQKRRIRTEFKSIIFIGGSQGAKAINDLALQAAPKLLEMGIHIIHQCGQRDFERVKQAYMALDSSLLDSTKISAESSAIDSSPGGQSLSATPKLTLFDFDKDLITHLERADICVGRAGASSIWENAAMALPTIYIPYPYAAQNHQYHNASYFTQKQLGLMIVERDLYRMDSSKPESTQPTTNLAIDLAKFFSLLSQLESNLTAISTALSQTITANGAESITTEILQTLSKQGIEVLPT